MKHLSSDFHARRLNDLGGVLYAEHVSGKRLGFSLGDKPLWVCVGFTAKRLQNLAQGGGFAEPWVCHIKAGRSEGA